MLVLPVTTARGDEKPTIAFNQPNRLTNLHCCAYPDRQLKHFARVRQRLRAALLTATPHHPQTSRSLLIAFCAVHVTQNCSAHVTDVLPIGVHCGSPNVGSTRARMSMSPSDLAMAAQRSSP